MSQGQRASKITQLERRIKEEPPPARSGFCVSSGTRPGLSCNVQRWCLSLCSSPKGNLTPCPAALLLHPLVPSPSLYPEGIAPLRRAVNSKPCFIFLKSCNIYINKLLVVPVHGVMRICKQIKVTNLKRARKSQLLSPVLILRGLLLQSLKEQIPSLSLPAFASLPSKFSWPSNTDFLFWPFSQYLGLRNFCRNFLLCFATVNDLGGDK